MHKLRYIILNISIFLLSFGALSAQNLTISVSDYSGMLGDVVCIDITVENFNGVSSMEWRTRFDPSVLRFIDVDLTNSAMNDGGSNLLGLGDFNPFQGDNGYVSIAWANGPPEGVTLPDGAILYTLCFELIGEPCETSIITTAGNPNVINITVADILTNDDILLSESEVDLVVGSVTIDPAGFVISANFCSTDNVVNTGSITFAGAGGNGPYSWSLTGSGVNESGSGLIDCETATIEDLGAGTYTLALTDMNNVTRVEIVNIVSSSEFPFVLTLDPINPTCFDRANGEVSIANIDGGESPFTYEWSNLNFVDDSIDKLLSGEYSLTITDSNGCTTEASTVINADTVKVVVDVLSSPSCDGSNDGVVAISAVGGTPYSGGGYDWDVDGIIKNQDTTIYFANSGAPANPFVANNYPAGCFEVVASDDLNCFSDPVEFCLEEGSFGDMTIVTEDAKCFGECNGVVLVTVADMGNFSFMLADQNGTPIAGNNTNLTFDKNDLCPGEYILTINDTVEGCTKDTSFTIEEPLLLEIAIDSMGPGCGGGDGMVELSTVGGVMDYTYLWNDSYDQPIRTNMGGGNYSVTVTDMNGCRDSIMWTFGDGGDIGLSGIVCQAVSCGGETDGSICASVTAPGTFSFSWEDSNGVDFGTGAQIDNVGGGIYYVTATDGICTDVDTVIVADGQIVAVDVAIVAPSCNDTNDGMLTATLSAGVTPAMFAWTQPPSTSVLSSGPVLTGSVGIYNLNVIDLNGCEIDTLIEITGPSNPIIVDISNVVDNPCFGECIGQATFTASGGPSTSGIYTFFVNGNAINSLGNTESVATLCGGQNFVLATDGVCLSDTFFFNVQDATPIMIDVDASTIIPPSCDGESDGSITVTITGGNNLPNYSLFWVNEGIMGNTLTGLSSGEYILEITDGNNCIVRDTIDLQTPDPLTVSVDPNTTVELSCFESTEGRIGLFVDGGNPGNLVFDWDPVVSNTDFADNLGPGTYSVTVTDVNGCSAETAYTLTSAPPIVFNLPTPAEPDCFGGQTCVGNITASGGVGGNFTFTILNGPNLPLDTCINLFAGGPYVITIFDESGAGCAVDTTIFIDQPNEITVDVGPDITIDLGSESDPISASIVSELDIDSIIWNPVTDIDCNTTDCQIVSFSPDETTSYTITVFDENGCFATDDIIVAVDLARNVFTPNIFSPNGDNVNDVFQLATGNGVEMVNFLHIFDRWGNRVFMDEAYIPNDMEHKGWDGTMNLTPLEPGVYVFVAEVTFIDGVSVVYKGDVTLVR